MLIYPAMDLMDGGPVRLAEGDFAARTDYAADPLETLRGFAAAGALWAHVVDLDGARAGAPRQHDLVASLAADAPLRLQVAGGIREEGHAARLLEAGAARVVVGSLAVTAPEVVAGLLERFGAERVAVALDVRIEEGEAIVATHGWTRGSGETLAAVAERLRGHGLVHLLVTDIGRDGMLAGPNLALAREVARRLPWAALQASGGVASLTDLAALAKTGAAGAVVGKALWEGRFGVAEAIRAGA